MSFIKGLAAVTLFLVAGCVSTSTFEKQVLEARSLQENLQSVDVDNRQLRREKELAISQLTVMTTELQAVTQARDQAIAERDRLRQERERLASDNSILEKAVQARADTFAKTIDDLRQKGAETEFENVRLRGIVVSREEEISRLKGESADFRKTREQEIRGAGKLLEDLLEKFEGELSRGDVAVSELQGTVTLTIAAAALFDSGKADLRGGGLPVVKKIAEVVSGKDVRTVRVEGHTDAQAIKGGAFPSSWELSALRAAGVTRSLQQQGVNASILSAAAFGQSRAIPGGDGAVGGVRNNRIDIIFSPR